MESVRSRVPGYLHLLLLLGLLAMLAASAYPLFRHSGDNPGHAPAPQAESSGETAVALSEEQAGTISALMAKLRSNPNDADALMEIGDAFVAAGEWNRAEIFLTRAVLSRPADARPRYLLGLAQYRAGKMEEAAKSFEELLSLKEDPAAMFNLAVIYKYHLNKKDEARNLLSRILDSSSADMDTLDRARKELD